MRGTLAGALRGSVAGAAGTTALNATTYLDMALRGRPPSTTPEQTVERMADKVGVRIPGGVAERRHRVEGLGPLLGVAAGIAAGAVVGAVRGAGWRPSLPVAAVVAALSAIVVGSGPMTLLGVSDVRSWSAKDWLVDVVPHFAYGTVTAGVLAMLDA